MIFRFKNECERVNQQCVGVIIVPVAQWLEHCKKLWVQYPGSTHTDKIMYSLNALYVTLDKSVC